MTEKRLQIAQELAGKGDIPWESLSPSMVEAYLHNADGAIAESEANVTPVKGSKESPFACLKCKDATVKDGKPCQECNPRGLPKAEVSEKHAESARRAKAQEDRVAAAQRLKEAKQAESVIVKINMAPKPAKPTLDATLEPKPGEYRCLRCNSNHRENSKIGKKHLKDRRDNDEPTSGARPDNNPT